MNISQAYLKLIAHECVIMPSDTLYGIAALAYSAKAVEKVFAIKKRPLDKQLPVHYVSISAMKKDVEVTPLLKQLAKEFWPGPLTIIANKRKKSKLTCVGETVAVRIPSNEYLLALLGRLRQPLVMPSANKHDKRPFFIFDLVKRDLQIDGVKDDESMSRISSTIIDITTDEIKILRKGHYEILKDLQKYIK